MLLGMPASSGKPDASLRHPLGPHGSRLRSNTASAEGVFFLLSDSSVPTDKADLRRTLRAKRQSLSADNQKLAARALAVNVAGTRLFLTSRRIACYLPNDGEIDTRLVIEHIRRLRQILYLPVLSPLAHDRLWFAEAK